MKCGALLLATVAVLAGTLLAGPAAASCRVLGDFEGDAEVAAWSSDAAGARVEATTDGVALGERAGVFIYPASEQPSWPMIELKFEAPQDWSALRYLGYHYCNISERSAWFWCQIAGADGRYAQVGYSIGGTEEGWGIHHLQEFAGEVDLARVTEVRFMLARPKQEMRVVLDAVFVGDEIESITGFEATIRLNPARAAAQGLEGAFRETLFSLYGPGLVDQHTGLPYEFFSITERKPSQADHPVHRSIGGDDTTEQHTPYTLYAIATLDPEVIAIEQCLLDGMTGFLDPGDGLVGCYRWNFHERKLGPFWGWFKRPGGENYQLSDAEHGAEVPLYSLLPGAWLLGHRGALTSLERYARTMLSVNSDPRYPHFHLYLGRDPDGGYVAYDWDGKSRYGGKLLDDPTEGYSDIMQFWWIMPLLGAAALTEDAGLRAEIIARIEPIMDNVARFQKPDGSVATTYRMDGSSGEITKQGYMYEGGSPPINWARACYAMHALTGDDKYLNAVARYWKSPNVRRDLSLMIFHSLHTGRDDLAALIEQEIAELSPETMAKVAGGAMRDERWATKMALASIYTGDSKYLDAALAWEEGWRQGQYREIGGYYYYFSRATNTYVNRFAYKVLGDEGVTGHFISDHFRGPIVDLIVIKHLGDSTMGLVGRNLLLLGWLLPEAPHVSNSAGG